jgi:alkylation response protein AidB-like acyl-CoA dehydrogenase
MNPTNIVFGRRGNHGVQNSAANPLPMKNAVDHILAEVQALAPEITQRVVEMETARRIPLDLVEKLRSIGVFRAFAPRSHGGLELDMPSAIKIVEALSKIDGSIGWIAMNGMGGAIFMPLASPETYKQVYANGPDVIFSGSVQPAGKAEAVEGGWRVNGRWPFASGCQHADWIFGLCVMTKGGKPLPGPSGDGGSPAVRGFILPAREWQIEDTWYAAGLKGTGSHHISIKDKVVPEANFLDIVNGQSCIPGPLYQAAPQFVPLVHIPAATGVAEGALKELAQLANTGRQQQRTTVPMRNSELFQHEIGRIDAELRAARAFADAQIESHWRHALAGTLKDDAPLVQGAQAATWITATCVRVVDECFRLAGGAALYEISPLQRRLRDIHAVAQHAAVHQRNYGDVGKQLLASSRAEAVVCEA